MPSSSVFPKNRQRARANAVKMPIGRLTAVATSATFNETPTAVHSSGDNENTTADHREVTTKTMMVAALYPVWSRTLFEAPGACEAPERPSPSPCRQNDVAPV